MRGVRVQGFGECVGWFWSDGIGEDFGREGVEEEDSIDQEIGCWVVLNGAFQRGFVGHVRQGMDVSFTGRWL